MKIKIPHMLTIKECLEEIKTVDPKTSITEWFIRSLCKNKQIIYYLSGNKSLVDFNSLVEYLGGEILEDENEEQ